MHLLRSFYRLVLMSFLPACVGLVAGGSLPGASWRPIIIDASFLVVGKDAGLLTVPGRDAAKADCLIRRLQREGYPEICHAPHRLDRDTSGLLVLGRTPAAHRVLAMAFEARQVSKSYEALVLGCGSSGY
jgi:tRNA pseudouridine32 synthase/23S rRNA pseudouridine746 synthase